MREESIDEKAVEKTTSENLVTIVCDVCKELFVAVMNEPTRCPKCGVRVRAEVRVVVCYGGWESEE